MDQGHMRIYILQIQPFLFLLFLLKFYPFLLLLVFSPPLPQPSRTLNEKEEEEQEKKAACLENLVNVELLNG